MPLSQRAKYPTHWLNLTSQNAESPQRPQPRAHTPLTSADALIPTAQAPQPRISMAASSRARYHARCTHALAGGGHSHTACQTARAPRPRISIAASSRARYHARCTRALAGHALMRQHTQPCKCSAYNGPQPLTRTARPANAVPSSGPRGRARSPMETWPKSQPRPTSAGRLWPPSAHSSLAPQRPH